MTFINETTSAIKETGGSAEYSLFRNWSPYQSRKAEKHLQNSKKSKITSSTIKKYLDYFEDSFLIEAAGRYNIKGKAYIETPKKYYFTDLGLRNARINFRQFEQTHSMENVIYNELRMRGYNVDVDIIPVSEKIVVTKDIIAPYYDEYGIQTMNIYDFLLDPRSLE